MVHSMKPDAWMTEHDDGNRFWPTREEACLYVDVDVHPKPMYAVDPHVDCRTCGYFLYKSYMCMSTFACNGGDKFKESVPVRLYMIDK
jgi:hypothetical protein